MEQVSKKFGQPRKTEILYHWDTASGDEMEEETPDYPVTAFVSREGYFKKITPQSLRASSEQRFKEGDSLSFSRETHQPGRDLGVYRPVPVLQSQALGL